MTTATVSAAPTVPLRQDAGTIALVGLAHSISHFSQLLLAPLFPWLKDAFAVSYAELGLLMSVFFVVSCAVQALSGFVVDQRGPLPVLVGGLGLIALAAFGFSISQQYWHLVVFSMVAGVGNGVFHPVDYTLINHKISKPRLGHAYSVHGVTGSLGWAVAPVLLVPVTIAYSWRVAMLCAAGLALLVLAVVWLNRRHLQLPSSSPAAGAASPAAHAQGGSFDFLSIPAVWMCFAFFLFFAMSLSGVQSFAPEAARLLHGVSKDLAAMCLTIYMVCSAGGMLAGGFLASDPARCERIVGIGFGVAASVALTMGLADVPGAMVPVLFGAMGFFAGLAGPSRDLLVKRSTPDNATGRVYGVVYSGLDIGQAVAPLAYGLLMDHGLPGAVWVGIAMVQAVLIVSAFNVRRVRRTALVSAPA
ncbi:MFS transporter [Methylibium rhizosphaerae]|uniref:MFS transporter n=1 Tax=Methylibium rhizosphaerae TaxID=2570323 RepID=UPI001127331C|nr:MFS transporter [Methylibium rhizosphaerae]